MYVVDVQAVGATVKGMCLCCLPQSQQPRHQLSEEDVKRDNSFTLSKRSASGSLPKDATVEIDNKAP